MRDRRGTGKAFGLIENGLFIAGIGICLSIFLPALSFLNPALFEHFNYKLYDEFLTRAAVGDESRRVVIVDIDEKSLRQYGQWPWPRYRIAALLDRIDRAEPSVIALDMMFPEKDRTSIYAVHEDLQQYFEFEPDLETPRNYPDNDQILVNAIMNSSAVLGYQFLFDTITSASECLLYPLNLQTGRPPVWTASGVACNLTILSEATRHSGFFNVAPDRDGILRRVPLIIEYNAHWYPSLPLAAVLKAAPVERLAFAGDRNEQRLYIGYKEVPLNAYAGMLVNYRGGAKTFTYVSAADLLEGNIAEAQLKGKVVFIGTSAAGLKELRATPTDPVFPGVEVHATVADNLLKGDFRSRPAYALGVEMLVALVSGFLFVAALTNANALKSLLIVLSGAFGLVYLSWWLFSAQRVYYSPILPLVVLSANFAIINLLKFWKAEVKARRHGRDLALAQAAIIESMASLTETRDPETGGHIKRTQEYVRLLGLELMKDPQYRSVLTEEVMDLLYKSAPLHDIGKVGVSDKILLKRGELTDAEFEEMKKHTTIGRDVIAATQKNLGNKSFLEIGLDIAYTHHEKWDGSGYPQGLKGTQIPLFGRMMALADTYDALISRRVYKQGYSHEEAVRIITSEARDSFDPSIVSAFLKLAPQFRAIAEKYTDPQSD